MRFDIQRPIGGPLGGIGICWPTCSLRASSWLRVNCCSAVAVLPIPIGPANAGAVALIKAPSAMVPMAIVFIFSNLRICAGTNQRVILLVLQRPNWEPQDFNPDVITGGAKIRSDENRESRSEGVVALASAKSNRQKKPPRKVP